MKKAKDKYENSFLCAGKMEIFFIAFGVKVRKDDLDMCPPLFCHKCYKLVLRGGTCLAINVWPPHKCIGNCKICSFSRDQRKSGGTLSFQPDPATLSISEEVKNQKSLRGSGPLY